MQTLSDEHKRAAYDNIFGFDEAAINPFKDPSESRDQVSMLAKHFGLLEHEGGISAMIRNFISTHVASKIWECELGTISG